MSIKAEKLVLIIISICIVVLLAVDFVENGAFILLQGGLVSSLLILLGIIALIIAWVQYFKKTKK